MGAARIARGSTDKLHLGNIGICRDWGWAPDYVEAMWSMLQQPAPDDFVIATGETHSLEEFVALTFAEVDLDWKAHVVSDPALLRPSDLETGRGNPAKAARVLGWKARHALKDVVRMMVAAEMQGKN
jgi:GDPmannose 4,6-dehydratase